MTETLSDEDRKGALDRDDPFLEQGAEPPGRWEADELGKRNWRGQHAWRTRHGEAAVRWSIGSPNRVEGALYPDGTRGEARHVLDFGWRRRATGERRWIYGSIDIQPDDVVFADGAQPAYTPPPRGEAPNLEADLAQDAAFLAAIRDDRFAKAVYTVFRNRTFLKENDGRKWSFGDREAARLVRDLRGLGDSYQDWFPDNRLAGTYPDDRAEQEASPRRVVSQWFESFAQLLKMLEPAKGASAANDKNADVFRALRAHLARLGWRTENAKDRERAYRTTYRAMVDRQLLILDELKKLEARSPTRPAEWVETIRQRQQGDLSGPIRVAQIGELEKLSEDEREVATGGLYRRLTDLAVSGRITRDEYEDLRSRIK